MRKNHLNGRCTSAVRNHRTEIENELNLAMSRRTGLIERLRRIIFSPKFFAAGAMVLALGCGNAFAADMTFNPTENISIGAGDTLTTNNDTNDFKHADNDKTKVITLDGGTFSYAGTDAITLGTDSEAKEWAWGTGTGDTYASKGGTISVGAGKLTINNKSMDMQNGKDADDNPTYAEISKKGTGTLSLQGTDTHKLGALTLVDSYEEEGNTLYNSTGSVSFDSDADVNGAVNVKKGNLISSKNTNFNGGLTTDADSTLTVDGGTTTLGAKTMNAVGGSTSVMSAGTLNANGKENTFAKKMLINSGGKVTSTADSSLKFAELEIADDESMASLSGMTEFTGPVTVKLNGVLTGDTTSSLTFNNGAPVLLQNGGKLESKNSATFNSELNVLDAESSATFNGTANFNNMVRVADNGSLTGETDSTLTFADVVNVNNGSINVAGTTNFNGGLTTDADATLTVNGGTTTLAAGTTNTLDGVVNTVEGSTLTITGGKTVVSFATGKTYDLAGTTNLEGGYKFLANQDQIFKFGDLNVAGDYIDEGEDPDSDEDNKWVGSSAVFDGWNAESVFKGNVSVAGGTEENEIASMYLLGNSVFEKFVMDGENKVYQPQTISVGNNGELYVVGNTEYNKATYEIGKGNLYGTAATLNTDINFSDDGTVTYANNIIATPNSDGSVTTNLGERSVITREQYNSLWKNYRIMTGNWLTLRSGSSATGIPYDLRKTFSNAVSDDTIDVTNSIKSKDGDNYGNILIDTYQDGDVGDNFNYGAFNTVVFHDDGETVVGIDENNIDIKGQAKFNAYGGDLTVKTGSAVLYSGTEFGNGQGALTVNGGDMTKNSDGTYTVNSFGTLAFYRNTEGDCAPTINMDTITIEKGKTANDSGACLFVNTQFVKDENLDFTTPRTLMNIDTNEFNFNSTHKGAKSDAFIWYDRISDQDADMIVNFNAKTIVNGDSASNATTANVQEIFAKPLVDVYVSGTDATDDTKGEFEVTVKAKSAENFANTYVRKDGRGLSENAKSVARSYDQARNESNSTYVDLEALWNEDNSAIIGGILEYYDGGIGVVASIVNNYGSYGSIASAFNSLSAATRQAQRGQSLEEGGSANSDKVQTDNLSQSVFANQNQDANGGASGSELTESAWASFTHTSINGYAYTDGNNGFDGYDVRRSGIMGGVRKQFNGTTSGGLFFAVTTPNATGNGKFDTDTGVSLGGYSSEMDTDDFQFALHLEKIVADYWEAAFFLGGGTQSYDWNRNIILDQNYEYTAETTGNTFTFTAYLARRLEMTDNWTLRPTIGLDSEHSWLFGFNEDGGNANSGGATDLLAQSFNVDTIQYSRNTARVGMTSSWLGEQGFGGMTARIFYGVQLDDDLAPTLTFSDAQGRGSITRQAHVMGGESVNLGVGGYWYLNKSKTLTATADINGIWYKNATTQNATGGISWRF